MKRRQLMLGLGAGSLLGACQPRQPAEDRSQRRFSWTMVTTWPKNFPGLGTAAAQLAETIAAMSNGRLSVQVYGAGERVPALEVFDAVSRGAAQMGHGVAYYWKGKAPAAPFFTTVPFGLLPWEMNAWLYQGGGLALWRELYAEFDIIPFEAGNTGTQMAGWFQTPLAGLADLRGTKMRIPGLGGEVMRRIGVTTVNVPGGELFTALQTGVIDAAEWIGPYNDLAFGLHKLAKHYYYPGWHEPGPVVEVIVNKPAFDALPEDLKAIVAAACAASGTRLSAEFVGSNQRALRTLVDEHGVQVQRLPEEVLAALRIASRVVLEELAAQDAFARRVYESQWAFREQVAAATAIAEEAYLQTR